jgi:hypothetical protein
MPFKVCGQCKKQCGPRTQVCSCGFSFGSPKDQSDIKEKPVIQNSSAELAKPKIVRPDTSSKPSVFQKIGTPAGKCPVVPEGYKRDWPDGQASDDCISNWAINTYQLFNGRMTIEAVVYYARQFWDYNGPEYRNRVLGLIHQTLRPQSSQEPLDSEI